MHPIYFMRMVYDMSATSSGLDAYSARKIYMYTRRDNNPILLGRIEHNADIYIYIYIYTRTRYQRRIFLILTFHDIPPTVLHQKREYYFKFYFYYYYYFFFFNSVHTHIVYICFIIFFFYNHGLATRLK